MRIGYARYVSWVTLAQLRFSESDARVGTLVAAGFNFIGMILELMILRGIPSAPRGPVLLSAAASAVVFTVAFFARPVGRSRARWMSILFMANIVFMVFALTCVHPHFARYTRRWVPFQGNKLGMLLTGMFAPSPLTGVVSIALLAIAPIVQLSFLSPNIQAQIRPVEPWACIIFGVAGAFVLAHRLRVRRWAIRAEAARADAAANRRLAHAFLELRDCMNTPLQSIEIAGVLLRKKNGDPQCEEILDALQASSARLRELSRTLNRYEKQVDWNAPTLPRPMPLLERRRDVGQR